MTVSMSRYKGKNRKTSIVFSPIRIALKIHILILFRILFWTFSHPELWPVTTNILSLCKLHALLFCGCIVRYSAEPLLNRVSTAIRLLATCSRRIQRSKHVHDTYFPNNTYNIMQNKSKCDRSQPLNAATAGR